MKVKSKVTVRLRVKSMARVGVWIRVGVRVRIWVRFRVKVGLEYCLIGRRCNNEMQQWRRYNSGGDITVEEI